MSNAMHDQNNVPTLIAILDSDKKTISRVKANPIGQGLKINDATTANVLSFDAVPRDENSVPCMSVLSSAGDGSIVILQVNSSGELLVDSTA